MPIFFCKWVAYQLPLFDSSTNCSHQKVSNIPLGGKIEKSCLWQKGNGCWRTTFSKMSPQIWILSRSFSKHYDPYAFLDILRQPDLCDHTKDVPPSNTRRVKRALIHPQYKRHGNTGWPKSKFEIYFGYNFETMHFWPHVSKAKIRFRGVHLIWNCKKKQLKNQNKCTPLKRILALSTWGQKCIVSEL